MNLKETVCPHCSRHCAYGAPKCSQGRAYFALCAACAVHNEEHHIANNNEGKKSKWEVTVVRGGPAWQLLFTAKRIRKALRRGAVCEKTLMEQLTPEERSGLVGLLEKMDRIVPAE